ncbi:bifunctional phosphopantothenoylcysteine decarboxylase/phosphopantothenate--cysteine ligase CoaBC [Thermotoga sp.]|uniref:bifunctional phosphopantothenoylcysteine decarboxylase/phosphopantothenate--cysteine ligase CoaBC n=1 Tax=Thermotoga sp. TaxID=28240 RepID=UPI0025E6175A|nr:bifunctional phosphopantothenoylcysteine decarboxylase/phosphopantothenate--cysteine ligase CoaBC [Thermotoga sp.]MCD6551015.1 bifunctional phosphopantothenoylcysteine decarboxylase/phosphopantothenate--cysteine ligase CoaBC [Thermotoga sp.]
MKIVLGVSSGIAIYKAVDLVSRLRKENHKLCVVMTPDATKLVSPVVFSSVGNCPVYSDWMDVKDGWIPHTELSRTADMLLIAPATANTISKIANGIADNLLTLVAMGFSKKAKILVPTMNHRMYVNPIFQENLEKLKKLGWFVVEPEEGYLACGEIGKGRYPENEKIVEAVYLLTTPKKLAGKRVLITAGPTRERIDTVRFITNASSGKMGYALATVAKRMGATVCLVSGPTYLRPPYFVDEFVSVESSEEMFNEVMKRYDEVDIVIMNAAVGDYRPKETFSGKLKKTEKELILHLERTKDILEELGHRKKHQFLVGFAAEIGNFEENALKKLRKKNLDLIILNDARKAFSSERVEVFIYAQEGLVKRIDEDDKIRVAGGILDVISNIAGGSSY